MPTLRYVHSRAREASYRGREEKEKWDFFGILVHFSFLLLTATMITRRSLIPNARVYETKVEKLIIERPLTTSQEN